MASTDGVDRPPTSLIVSGTPTGPSFCRGFRGRRARARGGCAVVVGTDGSSRAQRAVDWAAEEAARRNAPVLVIHAAGRPTVGAPGARPVTESELATLGEKLVGEEVGRLRQHHPGMTVTGSFVPGRAEVVLVEASHRAALVVVGARGLGPFAGPLLGSVSQKVAAHASGPVAVLREETPPHLPGPVVVGADPADPPVEALDYAFEEAPRRDVAIVVVSAGQELLTSMPSSALAVEQVAQQVKEGEERLEQLVERRSAEHGVPADVRHMPGHPADAIVAVAGTESIVVVDSRGHLGLAGLLLGSVCREVINRAPASIIVRVAPIAQQAAA